MRILIAFILSAFPMLGATVHVTQAGAGSADGTSQANAYSVATFNALTSTAAGDTVSFSGTFTSTITPADNGSAGNHITLDMSAASVRQITFANRSYLTVLGGEMQATYGIVFSGTSSHDLHITGFWQSNSGTGVSTFVDLYNSGGGYNLTFTNNMITNIAQFVLAARTDCHDLTFVNNAMLGSTNTSNQTDLIFIGDAYNVTIKGNYILQRSPGDNVGRHNDGIQCFRSGASPNYYPTNWVIAYNWIELDVLSGSGDNSWTMLENMDGNPAYQMYGNVFVGKTNTFGNNGATVNSSQASAVFYSYHNTFVSKGGPVNQWRYQNSGSLYARNNVGWAPSTMSGTFIDWGTFTELPDSSGWNYNFFFQWDNASSTHAGANGSTSTDPAFEDIATDKYWLSSSSTLLGDAVALSSPWGDYGIAQNATWPNPTLVARGASPDPGAYQFTATGVTQSAIIGSGVRIKTSRR